MNVPEYWVADIKGGCVFAYSDPRNDSYRLVRQLHRGESLAPELLPECRVRVDDFLP
jgi:Uma2 family endonuclease